MKAELYVPGSVIDELIRATGFTQLLESKSYNLEYKCEWLLERIGIMKRDADTCNIVHDNPEVSDLVAAVKHERSCSDGRQHTINLMITELDDLRRTIRTIEKALANK